MNAGPFRFNFSNGGLGTLFYDLESGVAAAYEAVVRHFDVLGCGGKWHVEAGGAVQDLTTWQCDAGASHIVKRKPTDIGYKQPWSVNSNVAPPALHVGKQILFFLSDGILVDDGRHVGEVSYAQLTITCQNSHFIEGGVAPRDAAVSHYAWKHIPIRMAARTGAFATIGKFRSADTKPCICAVQAA